MQPDASSPNPPLRHRAVPRPGRFGLVQLIAVEALLLAVATAVFGSNAEATIVAGVLAGLLALFTLVRAGGRWLYQAIGARARLGSRRAHTRAALHASADPAQAAAPGLRIRTVTDRGVSFGVGQDPDGWFAALGVLTWIGPAFERPPSLALDRVVRLLADPVTTISALQVVTHHTAAVPQTGTAANDLVWLAMRLDTRDAVDAAASRGGGLDGVDRALAAAVGRTGTVLNGADVPSEALDASALHHALTVSNGLYRPGGYGPADAPADAEESWRQWTAGGLAHVCFAIRSWPAQPGPDLLEQLAATPAAAVDTAVLVTPGSGGFAVRALIRISGSPGAIAESAKLLREHAQRLGVRLVRADGDHGTGVYATAPTAWTPAGPTPSAWAVAVPAPAAWAPQITAPRARPPALVQAPSWQPPVLGPGGHARLTPPSLTMPSLTPPSITMPRTR